MWQTTGARGQIVAAVIREWHATCLLDWQAVVGLQSWVRSGPTPH